MSFDHSFSTLCPFLTGYYLLHFPQRLLSHRGHVFPVFKLFFFFFSLFSAFPHKQIHALPNKPTNPRNFSPPPQPLSSLSLSSLRNGVQDPQYQSLENSQHQSPERQDATRKSSRSLIAQHFASKPIFAQPFRPLFEMFLPHFWQSQ